MARSAMLIALIIFFMSSCIKEDPSNDPSDAKSTMTDLVISSDFDFTTAKNIELSVYDLSQKPSMIQVFVLNANESPQLSCNGVIANGQFSKVIRIPNYCKELLVVRTEGANTSSRTVAVTGNTLELSFDPFTKSGQSSSCTDLLYTVNNEGLFYTIDLDNFQQVVIDSLPFSGSNACAVDTINKRVYTSGKNAPRPLYYYDIETGIWVFVANMNQSWVRMDYNHVTNKIYGGRGNKIYIVDPITGTYDATYNISGLHSTTGGDIVVTPMGSIFMCTFSGLYHLEKVGSSYVASRISAENLNITPTSMAFDRDLNLYLGSTQKKLVMMDTADGAYQLMENLTYKINDLGSLPCSIADLANIDTDGDGIIDDLDEYPTDSVRAFESYTPSQLGWGSLAFEDLWPSSGDYDFNDLAVNYRFIEVSSSQNLVVELIVKIKINNIGASFKNGFGIEFPFSANLIQQVSGYSITESIISLDNKGLEQNQTNPVVIVFDNAFTAMDDTISVVVQFTNPVSSNVLGTVPFNPFIFINGTRARELHLPDNTPTSLAGLSLFGTEDDASNPSLGTYYKTGSNHPWSLDVIHEIRVPLEKTDINQAYNHFSSWAESSGVSYSDWYKDNPGYRNTSHIKLN
jgi:LruC domain-containing protein